MENWAGWDEFLKEIANKRELTKAQREAFQKTFAKEYLETQPSLKEIADGLGLSEDTYKKRMTPIFDKFSSEIGHDGGNKSVTLMEWLKEEYVEWWKEHGHKFTTGTKLDWREICHSAFQTQLEINKRRRQATEKAFELGIHVPLGLVERKQQARRQQADFAPERGMEAYQPTEEVIEKRYEYDVFLKEIIGDTATAGKNIAIIGEPGAGKTTLLEKIGEALRAQENLPIFIPLSNLGETSLQDYLLKQWRGEEMTLSQLRELLETQRVWLLLDGVDEMALSSPLDTLYQQLAGLRQARVVLTCRLNVWDASTKNLPDFQTFKTLEFSESQVEEFVTKWFKKAECEKTGAALWQKLNEAGKERLKDLVKNPLRLALLCQTWYQQPGELPETQAMLYERFVRYHYEWKNKEFSTTKTQQDELNQALARLALEAIERGKTRFRIGEKFAREVMGEEYLNLACRLGWLNQVDRDRNTEEPFFAFFHPTFQEYFAACAVENWQFFLTHVPENPQQGFYRIFEQQWKQVILLWLGRWDVEREEKEGFIKTLVEFEDGYGNFNQHDVDQGFYEYRAYFLAAVGIVEFKHCSLIDNIIRQIIKWSFGYFNIEKQEWRMFLYPIQEAARETLSQTIRDQIISEIGDLLGNCPDKNTQWSAAERLGEIDPGNEKAIAALISILADSTDEYNRMNAAERLGEIDPGNEKAIAALISLLADSTDENTRSQAAERLGKIDPGNEKAIAALISLLADSTDEFTRWKAAWILGRIVVGNEKAITALISLLADSTDEDTRRGAAWSLGRIAVRNEKATATLISLLADSTDERTRRVAAESLGKIDPGNEKATAALISLLADSTDEDTRWRAARSLGKIDPGNEKAITTLISILADSTDEDTRCSIANSLGEIDPGNEKAIAVLISILADSTDESIPWLAAESLGRIAVGNEEAIAALISLLADSTDESTCGRAADSLGEIAVGNEKAIAALVSLLTDSTDGYIYWKLAWSLQKIIATHKQYAGVVSGLKDYLADEVYNNDFDRFKHSYNIIWHCAQNLPYPDFYQAWHNPPTTPHPEVQETTGVGITPTTLNLNLENLPANLTTAIQNHSDLVDQIQFVCFDASQFINADNPASEIYAELVSQGYPERQNGEPKTLQELKVYRQLKCPKVFLIFYEVPSNPPPQGLSSVFLAALSKFSNANRIAVISDAGEIPLQCFSPSQPNLIEAVVSWMRGVVLES